MRQRMFVVVTVAVVAAAVLAGPSAAGGGIQVHVRVEGKAHTIFGSTEPLVTPFQGTLLAEDRTPVELRKPTVLGALEAASARGEFFYNIQQFAFGSFVNQIGRFAGSGLKGWFFQVNGKAAEVGAADVVLKSGDHVLWYRAKLDATTFAGPATLDVVSRGRCIIAREADSNGRVARAKNVVFRLDETRRIRARKGRICPAHWDTARAVKRGLVRSNTIVQG